MDEASVNEKSKPFKLVKYFSFISLTLAFLGTVVTMVKGCLALFLGLT